MATTTPSRRNRMEVIHYPFTVDAEQHSRHELKSNVPPNWQYHSGYCTGHTASFWLTIILWWYWGLSWRTWEKSQRVVQLESKSTVELSRSILHHSLTWQRVSSYCKGEMSGLRKWTHTLPQERSYFLGTSVLEIKFRLLLTVLYIQKP